MKLNRSNVLSISAVSLLIGAIGPWVSVLGIVNLGPTNSLEVGLVIFGGIGLVILSALTGRYMRPVSIVVGLFVLGEAVNVWVKINNVDSEYSDFISTGWGLYLSILTALFLVASTFLVKAPLSYLSVINKPDTEADTHNPYGRCDTCGWPCDVNGCMNDRKHKIAIEV